jgi:hypothetical protein
MAQRSVYVLFERKDKMKRMTTILLALVIATTLLLVMTLGANAQATRTKVTSYEHDCLSQQPDKLWMEGDVLHIRGVGHKNVNISDTAEMNGINTTVADADINMKTGYAYIRGTMSLKPKGIQGTWEGTWVFINSKGVNSGSAVAHGTGALEGKSLFLKLYDSPTVPETARMCADFGPPESSNSTIEGYILDPGGP